MNSKNHLDRTQNTRHSPQGVSDNKGYTNAGGALRLSAHSVHSSRRGAGRGGGEASEHAAGMAAGSSLQALLAALINCAQ